MENYERTELLITEFDAEDVITTSAAQEIINYAAEEYEHIL